MQSILIKDVRTSKSIKDMKILKDLAKRQLEIAKSEKMQKIHKDWLLHNTFKGDRPMITVEVGSFAQDIIPDLLQCEGDEARSWEYTLRCNIINHEVFGDDTIVKDFIPVYLSSYFKPFGIDVKTNYAKDSLGRQFVPFLEDLEKDFHKLKKSEFGFDKQAILNNINNCNEIFGDVLPAKLTGYCLYSVLTQNIVHIMSMENMFLSMYDYPDLFKKMMDNLSNDYIEYFDFLSKQDALLPTTGSECVAQGSYCFTDELPSSKSPNKPFTSKDVWGFVDSQETVGISAEMFEEFIFPYYKKITDCYGLLSYGCCEPVYPFWENCISKFENLRKISISPWCNEEFMGEKLAGRNIIYHRKPCANFLGVGDTLDEGELRKHIAKTLIAAKGCKIEFTQRDVYKINKDVQKVKRYVEIIREEIIKNYK